jgi:hypothetical protein
MPLIPIEQFGLQLQQSGEISGELPFQVSLIACKYFLLTLARCD